MERLMRILIINYEFPPLGGGASKQTSLLANELSKKHKVIVITSLFGNLPAKEETNNNLTVYRINVYRRHLHKGHFFELLIYLFKGCLYSIRLAKNEKIDKTIAFFAVPSGIIAVILKYLFKIPYTVSLRGFDVPGFLEKDFYILHKINRPFIRLVLENADNVATNGIYISQLLKKFIKNLDVKVIYNAVQIQKNYFQKKTSDGITILTVGRLTPQKRINKVIEVLENIKSKVNFKFLVVGDGPLKNMLIKKASNSNINNIIEFLGWKSKKDLDEIYKKSDIFVQFSIEEGMSNVLLEAMSYGLPIIAINTEVNQTMVQSGENGYLVSPLNINEAIEKFTVLIENKLLRNQFGMKSLEMAKKFSPEIMAKEYEKLLK